jgi:Mn2+/Fe2+ NRAMP family transporter
MMADMDASSTIGAIETGMTYGYKLVLFLLLLIIPLFLIQEVSGRIGVATKKGLGEVIRENYDRKIALLLTLPMFLTDMATYTIEYLGAALGLAILGIPPLIGVFIIFLVHILILIKREYIFTERILLGVSLVMIIGFALTLLKRGIVNEPLFYFSPTPQYIFFLSANAGAVIMPFMLFFQASATAEKMISVNIEKKKAIKLMRIETLIGGIVTELLMVIVEMASTGLDEPSIYSPKSFENAFSLIAGPLSPYIFSIGLVSSAFLALVVISLGSAWGAAEALSIPRNRIFMLYLFESIPALVITILTPAPQLGNEILNLLSYFTLIVLGPAIVMGLIARNKRIMGEYTTNRWNNVAYWLSVIIISTLGILSLL